MMTKAPPVIDKRSAPNPAKWPAFPDGRTDAELMAAVADRDGAALRVLMSGIRRGWAPG